MRRLLSYNTALIVVAIGVITVSTGVLSIVGYHYTAGRANLGETMVVQSNIKLANQYIDRIEQKIIDNDRTLFEMVDLDEPPAKRPQMVDAIQKADLNVDQVFFFRRNHAYPDYPPYSYAIRNSWGAFNNLISQKDIDIDKLVLNQAYHIHKERPSNYFFATYVLKENRKGQRFLVCFQYNFEKIVALCDKYLRDLQPEYYVSIVDYDNNGIYNQPISRSSKYFYEGRFPSTLYKWILQIVPRKYIEIERDVRNQRRTNLFLIILSMTLIFSSLAFIYAAERRDRQLRKLKEDFISNVSHELKTPLSLIGMFSEVLKTGRVKSEETKQEYFEIIHSECERMSRLVSNLLDFASLERGERVKHFETVNLAQLVTRELEAYRHQIQKDGFQISADVDSSVPDTFADPNAISMAFLNLLDNSVKYSGSQKLIRVGVVRVNGFIDLSISDQGPGIPVEEQQKIFEKFYRGSAAAANKIRGSGIGLSIIRHVADMHGGEITVQSEPGKGSTFTLRIPIRSAPDLENKDARDTAGN